MGPGVEAAAERLRVFVVDDHRIVRDGLRMLLEAQGDMEVVGEAADGISAVEQAPAARPDVVVMDIALPRLGGIEATERLKASIPGVKVVALTAHEEHGYVQLLLKAGASGYLLKRAAGEELVHAIRRVANGEMYLEAATAERVAAEDPEAATPARLSDREVQVLRMIAEGHAMREVATALKVSARTLETYRARAMGKLGFKTRAEIVRYALQRGWLTNT